MASRSAKKRQLQDNKPKFSQEYMNAKVKKDKIMSSMPFVMLISLLLIGIFFFLPLTGLNVTIDGDTLTGETQEEPVIKDDFTLTSSVNSFSIIFNGFTQDQEWVNFLTRNLVKGVKQQMGNAIKDRINEIIEEKVTPSQRALLDDVMWMQFYISIALVIIWISLIILSIVLLIKKKSILPLVILSILSALLSIVEFITLIAVALGGMAGTTFSVNFGAYLLPIVCIALSALTLKAYLDIRKANTIIKNEEAQIETLSSVQ